MPMALYSVKI